MKDLQKKFINFQHIGAGETFYLEGWPSVKITFGKPVILKCIIKLGFFYIAKCNVDGHKCTFCFIN